MRRERIQRRRSGGGSPDSPPDGRFTIRGDKKRKIKAALPEHLHGLRFHDLRHTCASLLIAQGAHPKVIQERLGHASITTTMNRYGHLLEGHDSALLDGLDAAHDEAASPPDNVVSL